MRKWLLWPAVTVGVVALASSSWGARVNAPVSVSAVRECLVSSKLTAITHAVKRSGGSGNGVDLSILVPGGIALVIFDTSASQAKATLASYQANPSLRGQTLLSSVNNAVLLWPVSPRMWSATASSFYRGLVLRCLTSGVPGVVAPTYLTTGGIEQLLVHDGATVNGIHYASRAAACHGSGAPGPLQVDPRVGASKPSYKEFLCSVSLVGSHVNLVAIEMLPQSMYIAIVVHQSNAG
jgi:hypothetical protein